MTCIKALRLALAALLALFATAPAAADNYRPQNDLILVLGAVPQEIPPYIDAMKDGREREIWGIKYWTGHIGKKPVAVALTGVGKVKAATVTSLLVTSLRPRLVLMSGTGSRPNPKVRTGDVIVATELYEHDAGSLTRNDMVYRSGFGELRPAPALLAIADRAIQSYNRPTVTANDDTYRIDVRRGIVATSDLFGVTEARIQTLRNIFHADIMEMESAAFAQTCTMVGVPWLVIRAGSNLSQEAPNDDYKRLGPIAARQAALFGVHLIGYL